MELSRVIKDIQQNCFKYKHYDSSRFSFSGLLPLSIFLLFLSAIFSLQNSRLAATTSAVTFIMLYFLPSLLSQLLKLRCPLTIILSPFFNVPAQFSARAFHEVTLK